MQFRFWWCLLHAFMNNRECSIFRTFSIEAVTMLVVSKDAHISNPNFIHYSDMKKFELSIKLRVERYIMVL